MRTIGVFNALRIVGCLRDETALVGAEESVMNALDILEFGHQTIMDAIAGLPEEDWTLPGVSGDWSVKDVIAHLTSFEHVLIDVLNRTFGSGSSPTLDRWVRDSQQFNDDEVARRRRGSARDVLAEYKEAHFETINLLIRIPPEALRQEGLLPWYGDGYDLEDFIVYTFYGHKREHGAQIAAFRDRVGASPVVEERIAGLMLA
jgi:hypothetical protein